MRNLRRLSFILTLNSLTLLCTDLHAGISGFGDFSNFTINKGAFDSGPSPNVIPGGIELTDNAGSETRSLLDNTPQTISTFNASFTYWEVNGSNSPSQGLTFVLQNASQGAHAVASGSQGGFGFNGFGVFDFPNHSAAVSIELSSPTGTSLYTQGSVTLGGANHTSPVDILSGDHIGVALNYNGSVLHETLTDLTTNAQSSFSYLINFPQVLGGSTAYVGFTAQTPAAMLGFVPDQQYVSDFQFNAVPEPSSMLLLAIGLSVPAWLAMHRARATDRQYSRRARSE